MRRKILTLAYIGSRKWRATLDCGHLVEFTAKTSRTPYRAECELCARDKG